MKKANRHICKMILSILLAAVLLIPVSGYSAVDVQAASTSTKNKKAVKLYDKKTNTLKAKSQYVWYKYVDVTGDGVKEAVINYKLKTEGGSSSTVCVYKYSSGKIKRILKISNYGFSKVISYKKSKGLVLYSAGHGSESYQYFKMSGGKYKYKGMKSRIAKNGGSYYNGPWYYYNASASRIKKAKFKSLINGIVSGKAKKTSTSTFIWG